MIYPWYWCTPSFEARKCAWRIPFTVLPRQLCCQPILFFVTFTPINSNSGEVGHLVFLHFQSLHSSPLIWETLNCSSNWRSSSPVGLTCEQYFITHKSSDTLCNVTDGNLIQGMFVGHQKAVSLHCFISPTTAFEVLSTLRGTALNKSSSLQQQKRRVVDSFYISRESKLVDSGWYTFTR